ncbi:MAG: hypothetical protein ACR2N5_03045 [Solirubrobacterales bacterium]
MTAESPAPEFDGQCAFALSTGKRDVAGSPKHKVVDGSRTYYFKNGAAKFLWKVLPTRSDKASENWSAT